MSFLFKLCPTLDETSTWHEKLNALFLEYQSKLRGILDGNRVQDTFAAVAVTDNPNEYVNILVAIGDKNLAVFFYHILSQFELQKNFERKKHMEKRNITIWSAFLPTYL